MRAVFLDRDGTINEDPGYLSDHVLLKLLPGAREALIRLKNAGFKLIVISNQSGVGRGLIEPRAIPVINQRLNELLAPAVIDHFGLCFHRPEDFCGCRKPKPKLILEAARAQGVEVARSYMIGDRETDLEAGLAAK